MPTIPVRLDILLVPLLFIAAAAFLIKPIRLPVLLCLLGFMYSSGYIFYASRQNFNIQRQYFGTVFLAKSRGQGTLLLIETANNQKIAVIIPKRINIQEGQKVEVAGSPEKPFVDIERLYKTEKISETIYASHWKIKGWNWLYYLSSVRVWLTNSIGSILPEPEASLTSGLLIGKQGVENKAFAYALKKTNTTHIVSVSGYNFVIMAAAALSILLLMFKRNLALILALCLIPVYAFAVGFSGSVKRAGVFILLLMLARLLYRATPAFYLLLISVATVEIINPYIVLYDASYLLSLLASLGLIILAPLIYKFFKSIKLPEFPAKIISETWGASLLVAPVSLYLFSNNPIPGLFINLLVVPLLPLAMFTTALAIPFSLHPYLSVYGSFLAYPIPKIITTVIMYFGKKL